MLIYFVILDFLVKLCYFFWKDIFIKYGKWYLYMFLEINVKIKNIYMY